jgi:hypothetical protein
MGERGGPPKARACHLRPHAWIVDELNIIKEAPDRLNLVTLDTHIDR